MDACLAAAYLQAISRRGEHMTQFGIGRPAHWVEDRRFVTGRGRYLDDIAQPREAGAEFLRSPHAQASRAAKSRQAI